MSDRRDEKIRCDACPVMCYIADGNSGACDRYANHDGQMCRQPELLGQGRFNLAQNLIWAAYRGKAASKAKRVQSCGKIARIGVP